MNNFNMANNFMPQTKSYFNTPSASTNNIV